SSKSKLILSVSKSNNLLDGWWIYKLSGNPLNHSCWLDYPKLGISNNEIFVTGSLFSDLTGFSESIIFQISKSNALIGKNLTWRLWSDIVGSPITIIPASYGQRGNYGPGLYFVTQSPTTGNSVNLYEITNELTVNPQLTITKIAKSEYEPSGYALQSGTSVQLITGDCKILNAFYLDGIVHYVFQSDYQRSSYTGINYNRINVKSGTHRSYTYGQLGFDCAYPSVASYGTTASDKSVIFCFLRSGATIFPETRAIMLDSNDTWSNSILIKSGDTYVDAFEVDNTVRWGDYSGITYKFNPSQPEIWMSGCYGSTQTLFSTKYNCFNTWIGQIRGSILNSVEQSNESQQDLTVFPNPIIDLFSIEFNVEYSATIHIEIHDVSGKSGSSLFNGQLKKGKNILTFNKAAFAKGVYFLTIKDDKKIIASKKLFIE
ncbi:MAG: T9SS type A sorting domain-containing protein, partial [Candidatus Kapabacteria bacterium]|nr:T9SS type A sorting domain-containing protein [Candidatus Kapabacteria bacterium]